MYEKSKTLHLLVEQIADALGDEWRKRADDEPRHCMACIKRADGAVISMRSKNHRLSISGSYPRCDQFWFGPRDKDRPRITVSMGRTADAIAKDIERRFLPKYGNEYIKAVNQQDDYLRDKAAQEACQHELEEILHAKHRGEQRIHITGGWVEVYSSGSCRLQLRSVNFEQMRKIARLLAGEEQAA